MSLKSKAINGVAWVLGQQIGVQGINFVVQIILARLLMPEAFGLIAMLQIFMAIGTALTDSGMTASIIRTKDPDQADYSTVFYINILSSVAIYVALYLSAPLIATFFDQPALVLIIRTYTLSFVLQALVGVQIARLTKEMNFRLQMYMQVPATVGGGILGVFLAYNGFGVWSLVWMHLATSFLFMIQLWYKSNWKPNLAISRSKFRKHFSFGYKLTFSAILSALYQNSYTLIIGKLFSLSQLGYYNQANTLRQFPVRNLNVALQKVTYPLFATLQDENAKFKVAFKKITGLIFFTVAPIMLFLVGIAEPLFRYLLTEKWLPAVPMFQVLCVGAIFAPQSVYNLNIILAKGRSDLHLRLELLNKLLSSCFLLLIIPFGIQGAVYAQTIGVLIHFIFNSRVSGKLINYPLKEQLINNLPIIILSVLSFFILIICDFIFKSLFAGSNFDLLRIIVLFLIYFSCYLLASIIFRLKPIVYAKEIFRNFVPKKNINEKI